ncbi:hypothetical protein A3F34_03320 [Candidatus Roizmanbacteria bacterium RIFCSPHIGHO2_12_FULL_44_10]|uniref:LysM domain-containing protein n=1 Tax=Candidatus Roizmanbacteria bacterium RIFCSPHIGHO2_12_FULL_44_10 TaxID=1802054 RepID=A0A1F7I9U7_9BACT|nr:MAG: hypothetical protein A3F34_03320 [Candidatus Roizmanbacteria bacterium RIFCSPHIGHO2_12_FULL_44_10]
MTAIKSFLAELVEFTNFFFTYIKSRLLGWGTRFEKIKDIVVAFLVVKRGKYSQSFLNTSFFLLISFTLVGGPVVVENNPFISDSFSQNEAIAQNVLSTDTSAISFQTTISEKPRDKTIDRIVKPGETLASIAETYEISVDTIKWANNLKSDIIKPGQTLKILPITGIAHEVRSGESVYSIAKRYGVDAQNIVNFIFNDFEDVDTFSLRVGQTIYVPDGTPPQIRPSGPRPGRIDIIAGQPGTGAFIWPTTGYVSQYPVPYHMALDIANKSLPDVLASDTGTVAFSGCLAYGYGCHVIIEHSNGFQTLYGHMSRLDVAAGQGVSKGQVIGRVGTTGRSTGPHLHFEVRSGGALQNPLGYLR